VALAGCGTGTASGAQRLSVDLSSGKYVPSEITATAGTPISITFGKGQGCVKKLVSQSLKINADMTKGPQTFDVGVLAPGDYTWQCGMNMQHGVLHVK
jgi:Cu+-exporting ATPase